MAFTEKLINVQFDLVTGKFAGGASSATVTGLRCSAHINNSGGADLSYLELAVYGLPLSMMNSIATTGRNFASQSNNGVKVSAGDSNGLSLVFQGNIVSATVDAKAMPQVCLRVIGQAGAFYRAQPTAPISRPGQVKAVDLMSPLAKQMGFQFEDAGVTATLMNPYYPSLGPWQQLRQIAKHVNAAVAFDRGTIAVLPPGKGRQGDAITISPQTGLVGYPEFDQSRIILTALFNPAVKYQGNVQVQSDLTSACGLWRVVQLVYDLESMVPKGKWFMGITGIVVNDPSPP